MVPEIIDYPFQLKDAILISLNISRQAEIPEVVRVNVVAGVRVIDEQYPRIDLGLKLATQAESSNIQFQLEITGIFELVEGADAPDRSVAPEFAAKRGFFMLWAYADQIIRQVTAQMGVNPLKLVPPHQFAIKPEATPSAWKAE